jgi:hypothetical protein
LFYGGINCRRNQRAAEFKTSGNLA